MKLYDLELKNFKGVRNLCVAFDGQDMNVYGANEAGKTTLFDAFTWLLFGKDSLNRADFDVKPLSSAGEAEHGLEHEVSATLDVNGKRLSLRKVLAEKWTKKRGSADKEFTGHTVTYFIDGVPKSERDYKAAIASICDEMTFRLLTNPRHFSEGLKWQERRKVLLDVCGDITDADVIACSADLARLPEILKDRALEDHRKVIAAEHKRINDELQKIPIRISEQQQSISDTAALDAKTIRSRIAHLTTEKRQQEEALSTLRNGGEIAAKTKALREIESKLIDLENKDRKRQQQADDERQRQKNTKRQELADADFDFELKQKDITHAKSQILVHADALQRLRDEWREITIRTFSHTESNVCPTCGRELSPEMVEAAHQKALAEFNEAQARKLAELDEIGKAEKAVYEALEAKLQKLESALPLLGAARVSILGDLEELKKPVQEPVPNPDRQKFMDGKAILESALSDLRIGSHEEEAEIMARIAEIDTEIADQQQLLASIDMTEKAKKRIADLKREERELAAEYERLEGELFLTEKFVQRKVELLEDKINTRFHMARFKLFEKQINGGLAECCEITINGVPYWSANNAARTQVGLDVCNTLAEHYGFHPPVWVDNRESITRIPDMDCQVISLIVSPEDTALRFESITNERKAA